MPLFLPPHRTHRDTMMKGGSGGDSPSSASSFVPTGFLESLQSQQSSSRFNLLLLEHGEVYFGTSTSSSHTLPPSPPSSLGWGGRLEVYEYGGGLVKGCMGWGENGVLHPPSISPPRPLLAFLLGCPLCCVELMKRQRYAFVEDDSISTYKAFQSSAFLLPHPSLSSLPSSPPPSPPT